jgi:hypothetical protein
MLLKPNTPVLLYSNTPFRLRASEIFLSSLKITDAFRIDTTDPFRVVSARS